MIASPLTVRRLLNRLPAPRRATLQDLGHAAALTARAHYLPAPVAPELAALLDQLANWQTTAHAHLTKENR